jgi:hypothetical protein
MGLTRKIWIDTRTVFPDYLSDYQYLDGTGGDASYPDLARRIAVLLDRHRAPRSILATEAG